MKIKCKRLQPFQNMIAVHFPAVTASDGGLLLPDAAVQAFPARRGIVRAVGNGGFFENGSRRVIGLKVGDTVIAAGFGLIVSVAVGDKYEDQELINVDNVLSVIEGGD